MAIKLVDNDGKTVTTAEGTKIHYTIERPSQDRYLIVHPDDVTSAANTLHDHIKKMANQDVIINAQEVSVNGKTLVFLSSDNKDFYIGMGEEAIIPNARVAGINLQAEFAPALRKVGITIGRAIRDLRVKMNTDYILERGHPDDKTTGFYAASPKTLGDMAEAIYHDHDHPPASSHKGAPAQFDNPDARSGHADDITAQDRNRTQQL